jgi:hypothetical protein
MTEERLKKIEEGFGPHTLRGSADPVVARTIAELIAEVRRLRANCPRHAAGADCLDCGPAPHRAAAFAKRLE